MPSFIKSESLGTRLGALRESEKLTREQVAREIGAPPLLIRALEEDDYAALPAQIYAMGYCKKYLNFLQVEDEEKEAILSELRAELEVSVINKTSNLAPLQERNSASKYLRPFKIPALLGALAALIFLGYVAARLGNFLGKPELSITEPVRETTVNVPFTFLRGKVEKESHLTVNGREITIDQYGNFDARFELATGLNILEFWVEDRFGKINKEVRYVLVK
ncbi:MAG: hypothetical protein UX07_C0039G0004 [Parcubacteria group bacterium GW2011_GWA2_45_30]|nr:MAG: hypothetical protein UX07_C0039G0004 [Parcubacteria group bacterium GW2011_GWA2_45_30]